MEKKFEFIDIINELERVKLAPLILPLLKILDPVAKEIPEGAIKTYLTRLRPYEGQFRFLEKLVPYLPGIIRWTGKVASVKPVMMLFTVFAEALAFILKTIMPCLAITFRVIKRFVNGLRHRFIKEKQ